MTSLNLKLALRNLTKNRLYSFINISGLSIASAFCILTFWYVKNEQSFDNFHKEQDRLFRVEQTNIFKAEPTKDNTGFFSSLTKDDDYKYLIQTPVILAGDLKENFQQVESAVRLKTLGDEIVRVDNESFREKGENITFADSDFLQYLITQYCMVTQKPHY